MAISPPSDIILDVARAADPERLKVATAKLDRLADTAGTAFAELMPAVSEAGNALTAMDLRYVVGVQSSVRLWAPGTAPLPPKAWSGRGRPRRRRRSVRR